MKSLNIDSNPLFKEEELTIFYSSSNDNINIRVIDKELKKRGLLLSKAQRDEILTVKQLVISHKLAINLTNRFIYIAPYIKEDMPKKFKESCRINKIPKNIRPYIFKNKLLENLVDCLT